MGEYNQALMIICFCLTLVTLVVISKPSDDNQSDNSKVAIRAIDALIKIFGSLWK